MIFAAYTYLHILLYRIGSVMVRALASSRSWVRTPIGSSQRLWNRYLLLLR